MRGRNAARNSAKVAASTASKGGAFLVELPTVTTKPIGVAGPNRLRPSGPAQPRKSIAQTTAVISRIRTWN